VALSNDGDEVLLLSADDAILDAVSYGESNHFFVPAVADVPRGSPSRRRRRAPLPSRASAGRRPTRWRRWTSCLSVPSRARATSLPFSATPFPSSASSPAPTRIVTPVAPSFTPSSCRICPARPTTARPRRTASPSSSAARRRW
jgi:hypothetical protein